MNLDFLKRFSKNSPKEFNTMTELDPILTNVPWIAIPDSYIEPDNWDLFWKLWNEQKSPMSPDGKLTESTIWESLCIWKSEDISESESMHKSFPFKVYNWESYFPNMFSQIRNLMPFSKIEKITLSHNRKRVPCHIDPMVNYYPWPNSVRVMLWDTNKKPTFFLKRWSEDSLNKPPISSSDPDLRETVELNEPAHAEKIYVNLPSDTNSFVFSNGEFLHGADYAEPKIILLVWGTPDVEKWKAKLYNILKPGK